ncbi:MAG: hypothetical protein N2321_09695 [Melioribacteraceae bacterium]|nr:hypothetical protein [Melioribacteraceae bacterium]
MTNKKHKYSKEEDLKKEILFCTECGEDLSNFGIENKIDKKEIEERHQKCKQKGKFKGDMCSMIFISSDSEPLPPIDELD